MAIRTISDPDSRELFVFHRIDQLKELGAVDDLDEGLALGLVADHINRWGVIDADALPGIFVLVDGCGQFALGVEGKR
jgi:hypothetical protein